MKETRFKGVYVVEIEPMRDERGFFARSFDRNEFEKRGLRSNIVQCNISLNERKGTLRGMHYQVAPHEEAKLVTCMKGAIYDVAIDLRLDSPTYCEWLAEELSEDNCKMIYVPEAFAHGFQTLEDNTIVSYQMFEYYRSECMKGVRWNDKAFDIHWPLAVSAISERDRNYPDFKKHKASAR